MYNSIVVDETGKCNYNKVKKKTKHMYKNKFKKKIYLKKRVRNCYKINKTTLCLRYIQKINHQMRYSKYLYLILYKERELQMK